jgi:hypothetical protein
MFHLCRLILITCLSGFLIIADSPVSNSDGQQTSSVRDTSAGYSALKLFLEDEQHLTIIRRTEIVITFSGISEKSTVLIDKIADTSEQSLAELEKLSKSEPAFSFKEFSDEMIAKATIDSLRMNTVKRFIFKPEDFEKDLLISQLNILPVISHLARQLGEQETNKQRKIWLIKLAHKYENYYQQVNANIEVSAR